MKIQKTRRERLYKQGKPTIRQFERDDIRWLWAAARRAGNEMDTQEFQLVVDSVLMQAQRHWVIEDKNAQFDRGFGPIGIILATFDGWTLGPHAEWFPWATPRNKLRAWVGFLQTMRYARDTGSIKILTTGEQNRHFFKWLRRYLPIAYAGCIPSGRPDGDEHIFYLRGRKHGLDTSRSSNRRGTTQKFQNRQLNKQHPKIEQQLACNDTEVAGSLSEHHDAERELHKNQRHATG